MRFALYSAPWQNIIASRALCPSRIRLQFSLRKSVAAYILHTRAIGLANNQHMNSSTMSEQNKATEKVPEQTAKTGASGKGEKPQEDLPKLTPAEFRAYNRLAEHMDYFVHNRFLPISCIPSCLLLLYDY